MSTKISALDERLQIDINGEEFFPIIDGTVGAYHTYKIKLDSLFASDQGFEKVTNLVVTGAALPDRQTVADDNEKFTLTYTKEDNTTDVITIDKYKILANDVKFIHIDPAGYVTSTDRIDTHIVDDRLTTAKAVDTHIDHREALYDTEIKGYFGDSTTSRVTGNHVLKDFRLNSEVASDFTALLDGVNTNLNTFKKIEDRFATIDYSDKIGTGQVNIAHFTINEIDLNQRLSIKKLAVGTDLISNNAITTNKVRDLSIVNSKLSTEAVSTVKIQDGAITNSKVATGAIDPSKLSAYGPSWSDSAVSVPNNLLVGSDVVAQGRIRSYGTDFHLYSAGRSEGNVHNGRALVHNRGDRLTINYAKDYTGGVEIRGVVKIPDQTQDQILASGPRAIVTKEYVDYADIRIRPLDPTRIQDDCIQLRHMSDNSVGTFEILDDSITSAKVENIGPQWTNDGTVTIIKDLDVNGSKLDLGDRTNTSTDPTEIKLISSNVSSDSVGYARILRKSGLNGALQIDNKGSTEFSLNGSTKLQVSSSNVKVDTSLHITGKDSTTIGYNNFANPALLVGASDYGIAIDSNEIVQKGNHLHLGVADPATQNINFQGGPLLLTRIYGDSGTIYTRGGFITDSGVISTNNNTSRLILQGGKENISGADIELYGSDNPNHPGFAYYDADKHTFRSQDNNQIALTIDSKQRKVTLHTEGTSPNHLVTKSYVDKEKFPKITRLNDITLRMNSGFYETNAADTNNGWPESTGLWYHLLTSTHSNSSNYNSLQFAAPFYEQDVYFRSTNNDGKREWNKLWHTNNVGSGSGLDADLLDGKEAAEFSLIAHNHDTRYLKLSGGALTGDVNFSNDQQGIVWNRNTDGASIKFYNTGDSDNTSRLEFQTTDNRNEYFIFTHQPYNDTLIDLLKISNTELSYKANKIWHAGNDGTTSGLDADLLDGLEATAFSLVGHNHDTLYRKLTTKIGVNDLTTGAPDWQSNGTLRSLGSIFIAHDRSNNGLYTRNIYGRSATAPFANDDDTSLRLFGGNVGTASIELYDSNHASAADHISIKSTHTQIYSDNVLALDIKNGGHIVAPLQTQSLIASNKKSLTTKEYVTAEIAKVYPDDNYILRSNPQFESGVTINGSKSPVADGFYQNTNQAFAKDATNLWLKGNSAGASGIFFESSADGVRTLGDSGDGAFIQYRAHGIHGDQTGEQSDLVIGVTNDPRAPQDDKIVFSVPSKDSLVATFDNGSTEHKIWHEGNDGSTSGLDADKLDGYHASSFALKSGTAFTGDSSIAQGKTLRFIHGNAADANDGTISAGKFASGLNIVGTKTTAGGSYEGRQVRIWGDLITNSGDKYWNAGNDGTTSGLDADLLDGYHASDFAKPNTKISVLSPTADSHAATKKYVDNKTASLTNASTLDGIDSLEFINNTASPNALKSNLTPGWYTIAVNTGSRAVARFGLKDQRSSRHQSIVFYASHSYGRDDSNNITVLHSSSYNRNLPFKNIRIKEGETYDGAALQIFISNSSNSVQAFLLGDNFQTSGWRLRDWVPDSQNPNIGYSYPDPNEAQRSYSGYYASGLNQSKFYSTTAWSVDDKNNLPNEYVQLDLLQNQLFAGLQTRGRGDGQEQWVTKYKVAYSTDNITYTYINNGQVFTGNSDTDSSYQNIFSPVTARWVRVYPVEYFSHPSMRLRLVIDAWNVVTNVAGEVDLGVSNGGIITTDEVYAGGQTTQNKLWHAGNTTNAVVNTTIKNGSVSANKLSTGAPSWDTSKNLFVKGKLRLGEPVSGTTPGTEIYAERLGSEDILTVYANDKIVFQNGDRLPTMALDHDGNKVIIGSDTILLEQGKLHIDSAAVPLSFRETDQTGGGSFWRMPLDYESLRFDSSNDGTSFGTTGYTNVFQMYKNGKLRAPSLSYRDIDHQRSLVTKEYVDTKVGGRATTAYVDSKVAGITPGKLYHVNAIQKSQGYYKTADTNSSSNVTPNTAVYTYAKAVLPNLAAGDKVMVVWGYRTKDSSNGTTYAFQYATTLYNVLSASTWSVIKSGRII